jgi:isocitrate dehydrogenase (NAD+)
MILSGAWLLRYLGEKDAGDRLERAVLTVLHEGRAVTSDMKQKRDDPTAVGTQEMADAIISRL